MKANLVMDVRNNMFVWALLLLATAGLWSGCTRPRTAQIAERTKRADQDFRSGQYDKAKIEYLNLLRDDQQSVIALERLGFMWFDAGVPFRAIPFLLRLKEVAPDNLPARTKLALAFRAVEEFSEARQEAAFIIEQDPANTDAIMLLAECSQTKEEIAAAEEQLKLFPAKDTAAFHISAAHLALRQQNVGAASDELQQTLTLDPKSARAHLLLGYMYVLRRNADRARAELRTAAELAPLRSEERLKFAEFQAANGAADEAKALLQNMTKEAPDYLAAWRDLAQIALIERKYDEALSLLENVFSRDSENPDARLMQAGIMLEKGDSRKAVAVLEKLNSSYPNNPLIKYQLGRACLRTGDFTQATLALEQASAAKQDYIDPIVALAEVNLRIGKAQAVVAPMRDLIEKRPDLPQPRLLLGEAWRSMGRLPDAAALLREQVNMIPKMPEAHYLLGLVLRDQKKPDEARAELEKALELAPGNFNALEQLVDLDLAENRLESAAQRVEKQLQVNPDAAGPHYLEAKIHIARGAQRDWSRAEEALQKAIELDPSFMPAYEMLVSVYFSQNMLPEAIRQLKEHAAKNPKDMRPLLLTGMMYDHLKEYSKARDAYDAVLAVDGKVVLALNNLAYLYTERLDDLDKAYQYAQKARGLDPGDAMVADTLGWILYKRGDYQQALKLSKESLAKYADQPEVQFHFGMASYMMGEADAARTALEKAAQAATDFPGKEEAKRRLASLDSARPDTGISVAQLEARSKAQSNDPIVLINLAEAYQREGQASKAAATYEKAITLNPKLLPPLLKLAQLYVDPPLQDAKKALATARKARDLAPGDPQTAGALGRIALQAGNVTWAYSLLQESARNPEKNPAVLHDFAMSAYMLGRVPEARAAMEPIADIEPVPPQAADAKRFLKFTALEEPSPELSAAEQDIHQTFAAEPHYVPAMMAQAALLVQQNDSAAAERIYSDVLRLYPEFAPAQKRLAAIYAEQPENLAKARDLAMKARTTLAGDPEVARTLAEVSFKRKEFPYAIQLFQESAAKQPLPAKDLYYLGIAQLENRQETAGRESLEHALAAGLSGSLADDAKQRLAKPVSP